MHTHRPVTTAALLGAVLFLPGCFESDTSPTDDGAAVTDQEAIEYVVLDEQAALADPDFLVFDDPSDGAPAPIATSAWRRELLSVDRTVQVTIDHPDGEPPTADVKVSCDLSGILHLWVRASDDPVQFQKDFADHGVRSAVLRREREPRGMRHCGWQIVALSGVLLESPGTTRNIESVHIQARGVDETITNVTDVVRLGNLLSLPADSEAIITVKTGDASDQVFLHLRNRHARIPLTSNGDGTFTGRFMTGSERGPRHLGVDVLSEGTLFDDVAPYDNIAWGILYRVGEISPVS